MKRDRFGAAEPTGFGRLCNWTPDPDGPPADEYSSFGAYQRSLTLKCEDGEPGVITWRPDHDTPDTVYYQCFTHRYLGWKINVLDRCDRRGQASEIDEIYVQPDAPDSLVPAASIRHETKVKPNNLFLLQDETASKESIDGKHGPEASKMISDGILAAEALEETVKSHQAAQQHRMNDDAIPILNSDGEPVRTAAIEPLPIFLTPPRSSVARPFRHDNRPPFPEKNNSFPFIFPLKGNQPFRNGDHKRLTVEPVRRPFGDQYHHSGHLQPQKMAIPAQPLRRDYAVNLKVLPAPFPPQSLQKQLQRNGGPKKPFLAPAKDRDFHPSPQNGFGFKPDSVVVESGFTPIMRRRDDVVNDNERKDVSLDDEYEEEIFEEEGTEETGSHKQRRSNAELKEIDGADGDSESSPTNSELLIKTLEPMFIPSPPDSTNATKLAKKKYAADDLQFMEIESGEDKMAMAGERHAYYLPPDNRMKSTKIFPAGTVVTFDGKALKDMPFLKSGSAPYPIMPRYISSPMAGISSTEQLKHLPQFGPFKGEIPPLSPELMVPHPPVRASRDKSKSST